MPEWYFTAEGKSNIAGFILQYLRGCQQFIESKNTETQTFLSFRWTEKLIKSKQIDENLLKTNIPMIYTKALH